MDYIKIVINIKYGVNGETINLKLKINKWLGSDIKIYSMVI